MTTDTLVRQEVGTAAQPKLQIVILQNLAAAEARSGDNRSAKSHLEMALNLLKSHKSNMLEGRTTCGLAEVSLKLSDPERADAYIKKAIERASGAMSLAADRRELLLGPPHAIDFRPIARAHLSHSTCRPTPRESPQRADCPLFER